MVMQSHNPQSLEDIFHAALEFGGAADRSAYLDEVCAADADLRLRAEALIAAHVSSGEFLEQAIVEPERVLDAKPGDRIGPYKLLQQIGEGGMGVVFMAEQVHPVRRKVALKIIKLGMDTKQVIARFEAERQALALMEHSNIARVLDAGATESGRPYFVMELVRGVPIDEYCDTHQLPTIERLKLFMDTCRAVQHAHQKGIIHRDIKPGNVLVTSHDGTPVVKIIDFGVAKATNQRLTERTLFTEFRQFIGTPAYMSPEQAEMSGLDVDTRTDIYALGVLLYQLLTGSTPFDAQTLREAGYGEMTRMIREDEPPTPSTRVSKLGEDFERLARNRSIESGALVKLMRGDLDWIVMKAISKDRTRRYDSASALAEDVTRHLRDEPVFAGPPSALYRASKLFRRNRTLVLAFCLAALGLLAGLGLALTSYFAARAEAERSSKISAALTDLLAVAGTAEALDLEVASVLDTAREVFGEDHATVAATLTAMAGQLRNAGDSRGAEGLYEEALEIYSSEYGADHRSVGQTLASLGVIQNLNGDAEGAEASLRESLRIEALQPGAASVGSCTARRELARLLGASGRTEEADVLLHEALEVLESKGPEQRFELVALREELLENALSNPIQRDLAPLYQGLLDAAVEAFPKGHRIPLTVKFGLSAYFVRQARLEEAEPLLVEVVAELHAMESPPAVYLFTALDMLFQIGRHRTDPAGQAAADDTLAQFFEVAPEVWSHDDMALLKNYEFAAERFFDHERWLYGLRCGDGLLNFALTSADEDQRETIINGIGRMILKITAREELLVEELEFALTMVDRLPSDGEYGSRVPILRLMLRTKLGRLNDPSAELELIRRSSGLLDEDTLDFMKSAEALIERGY